MSKTIKNPDDRLWQQYSKLSTKVRRNIRYLEKYKPSSIALERYRISEYPTATLLKKEGYDTKSLRRLISYTKKAVEQTQPDTIRRAERLAIQTLKEYGVENIDGRNIQAFFRFMDDLRSRGLAGAKSSKAWAETYVKIRKNKLSKKDIELSLDYWAEQYEKMSAQGTSDQFEPQLVKAMNYGSKKFRR